MPHSLRPVTEDGLLLGLRPMSHSEPTPAPCLSPGEMHGEPTDAQSMTVEQLRALTTAQQEKIDRLTAVLEEGLVPDAAVTAYAQCCADLDLSGTSVSFTGGIVDMDNVIVPGMEKVYLRPCYSSIVALLLHQSGVGKDLTPTSGISQRQFVLGTPGTGKSVCRNFACATLVKEARDKHTPVYIMFEKTRDGDRVATLVVHVSAEGDVSGYRVPASSLRLMSMVDEWVKGALVVSLIDVSDGDYRRGCTVNEYVVRWYFSSPHKKLYKDKDRRKNMANDVFMETWTLAELQAARESMFQRVDEVVTRGWSISEAREAVVPIESVSECVSVPGRGETSCSASALRAGLGPDQGDDGDVVGQDWTQYPGRSSGSRLYRMEGSFPLVKTGDVVLVAYSEPAGLTAAALVEHRFAHFGGSARAVLAGPLCTLLFLKEALDMAEFREELATTLKRSAETLARISDHSLIHISPSAGRLLARYRWASPFIRHLVCVAASTRHDTRIHDPMYSQRWHGHSTTGMLLGELWMERFLAGGRVGRVFNRAAVRKTHRGLEDNSISTHCVSTCMEQYHVQTHWHWSARMGEAVIAGLQRVTPDMTGPLSTTMPL
ncbi:hypothetical protein KIPB_005455 [Kipferlia bialata]|uniref:Uncharacterized protein n=1 Tax=Kipferlia bialata TaxID=797122 RepID=A0A9K3CW16_9EUKA|nr:hypothetical protein KIPB_005455 [Kipferlia bialata]|eukprot:g5455.t1